ncbi:MAG TPA: thioredoxin [Gemmatimonadales bacterium]|nr:thioredoxin [Gemmatimonadales bacterium]
MSAPEAAVRIAVVRCPLCLSLNRVDLARVSQGPSCGNCQRPLLLDRPIPVSDEDFERIVRETEVPVVVDFYADWCGPCRMMAPALDEFASERSGQVLVLKLNTDQNPVTPQRFAIRGIPTLIVFRQGQEVGRNVGLTTAAQMAALVEG